MASSYCIFEEHLINLLSLKFRAGFKKTIEGVVQWLRLSTLMKMLLLLGLKCKGREQLLEPREREVWKRCPDRRNSLHWDTMNPQPPNKEKARE